MIGNVKIIGGVAYQEKFLLKDYKSPDGEKYTVELKDGTTIIYPEQPYEREVEVFVTPEGRVDFKGFENAVIIGTNRDDVYRLMGCSNVVINADSGKDRDVVEVTDRRLSTGKIQKNDNNKVCLSENDALITPDASHIEICQKDTDFEV